jgi:hypothetical protein
VDVGDHHLVRQASLFELVLAEAPVGIVFRDEAVVKEDGEALVPIEYR